MRDSGRELLEHLLEPPLQGAVLALAHPYYVRSALGYVNTLRDLLDGGDAGTVALVAYHVGQIGVSELAPQLERLRTSRSETIVTAVESTLAQLAKAEVATDGS